MTWLHLQGIYSLMSTGLTNTTRGESIHSLPGGTGLPDPFANDSLISYDHVEFKVQLTAPPEAVGFAIDYVFMSVEYEEYIGSNFNDKFYIQLNAPSTTSDQEQVINFTDCLDPNSYYDLISPLGDPQCYIAINTAFSESCDNVITDISGTGFGVRLRAGSRIRRLEAARAGSPPGGRFSPGNVHAHVPHPRYGRPSIRFSCDSG